MVGTYSYFNAKNAILKRTLDQLTSIRVIKKGQIEFLFKERFKDLFFLSNTDYIKNLIAELKQGINQLEHDKNIKASYSDALMDKLNYERFGFTNMFVLLENKSKQTVIFSAKITI
ncbi:MAG: hypothetical protein IPH57_05610 [Saprospiraceae bacterium]|nr:hypothetical protein [Saprospiraceae bacterium]